MKKLTPLLVLGVFVYFSAFTQGCLPEGITFTTQEEIDNFQTNYPGCKEIEGNVKISGEDITNLTALNVLTSIGANLSLSNNTILTNLSGLDNLLNIEGNFQVGYIDWWNNGGNPSLLSLDGLGNLSSIGGSFNIVANSSLESLSGIVNLTSIGENLEIHANESLLDLSGIESLNSLAGDLSILHNDSMLGLSGLQSLSSIGGNLIIEGNDAMINLLGLHNLTSLGESLIIENNGIMTSLTGIENIEAASIGNLFIVGNASLSTCEFQNICDYLVGPNGTVDITNNAAGCNNPAEIATISGVTLSCLPFGNYYFTTQTEIDNFKLDFPDCLELRGNVLINGGTIINLNGLNEVISAENLKFFNNHNLSNLSGLDDMTSISNLKISANNSLKNLTGLEGISIENIDIHHNNNLTSLAGLEHITSISDLGINSNYYLKSLSGLDNLTSAGNIDICENRRLESLSGLINLTTVEGYFSISTHHHFLLNDLSGLNNLSSIGGDFEIVYNEALTSLSGLGNLSSIGGMLRIRHNSSLVNIISLSNLVMLEGDCRITDNKLLTSLSGLDNIEASSIQDLVIINNTNLSTCDVKSICDYLGNPPGSLNIHNNAGDCINQLAVETACGVGVDEYYDQAVISVSPNPSVDGRITFTIENTVYNHITELRCFTIFGQEMRSEKISALQGLSVISIRDWKPGIYMAVVYADGKPVSRAKFVVQ